MGQKGSDKIAQLYEGRLKNLAGRFVSASWLRSIVGQSIGIDERTVASYMKQLVILKYVKLAENGRIKILEKKSE